MTDRDETKGAKKPPPSYEGNEMPDNVSLTMDTVGEEPTRRIGGTDMSHGINFGRMTPTRSTPSYASASVDGSSSISTQSIKPQSQTLPSSKALSRPEQHFRWSLREVPTLPEYHPLERTAVLVPNATPSDVTGRISDVLRERSIEAVYEDDKAKVKCTTAEGVDFRIRLYRGRGKYNHGIIVEVQRRFGTSVNFCKDTSAILDAAEGKETPVPPPLPPIGSSGSAALPLVSDDSEDEGSFHGSSSLEMVSKMLTHAGYDSNHLALQTLSSLTDVSRMGKGTARKVSTELLRPDNEVGARVLSLIADTKAEDDVFHLRLLALTILANAVQAVQGVVASAVREEVRPVLLRELHKAESSPRAAQMSARCFYYLLKEDHDLAELHVALEKALDAGAARHAGLMRQAQACLDKMP